MSHRRAIAQFPKLKNFAENREGGAFYGTRRPPSSYQTARSTMLLLLVPDCVGERQSFDRCLGQWLIRRNAHLFQQ